MFILLPRLRGIQADRMLILKLVLMVPRHIIYDFVNVMYRQADLDDEGDEAMTEVGTTKGGDQKIIQKMMKSSDVTEIIPDRNYKTYAIFTLGLFSLSLPAIIHCAWRFTHNQAMGKRLDHYLSNSKIFVGGYSFRWREQDLFATQCPDMRFCYTLPQAKESLRNISMKVSFNIYLMSGENQFRKSTSRICR